MRLNSLHDVFVEQIDDLYDAEMQLVEALPKLARAASDAGLRQALDDHLEETRAHVGRLGEIRGQLGIKASSTRCEGMEGLIAEGSEIMSMDGEPAAKDAALIGAAQRVEHYEIAAYGTAHALADQLGLDSAAELLNETLDEEGEADKTLTKLATGGLLSSGINRAAS
jgi:ferritin-like metal-binding protein YciE